MYRNLLILLLHVVMCLSCRPPPCHWKNSKQFVDYFQQVANKVIAADQKAENFCNSQGCANIVEEHEPTEYKLIIPAAGVTTYEVKVHNRVLQIVSDNCQNSVTELRILPPYVNGHGGWYYFDGSDLVVAFPYKYNPTTGGGSCEAVNRDFVTLYQRY